MGDLDGRVALVSGGSRDGVGAALADALRGAGATVVDGDDVDGAVAEHGRLDVLAVVVTKGADAAVTELTDDVVDEALRAGLRRPLDVMRRAIGPMVANGHGRVVFVDGPQTKRAMPGAAASVAAAHALAGLTKAAAQDLGTSGVTVNVISWSAPAEPIDVAALGVLLASDAGGGITGSLVSVDGGATPY